MRAARQVRQGQTAIYHVTSRVVGGQRLLHWHEREALRHRLWKLAKFLQVTVLDYSILSNHLHLILRLPAQVLLSDQQLLGALADYYGPKDWRTVQFQHLCQQPPSPRLDQLRTRYLARMGNLSAYLKELKEGFSKWYNHRHHRFGTLWAERFRSSLVPQEGLVLLLKLAYLDLNPVRAGQTDDPKNYRHCGYAEAVAQDGPAREGLAQVLEGDSWEQKQAYYRQLLFAEGQWAPKERAAILDPAKVLAVIQAKGELSLGELLRVEVAYLAGDVVFGTVEFVQGVFEEFVRKGRKRRKQAAWPVVQGPPWQDLATSKKINNPFSAPVPLPPDPPEEAGPGE